MIIDIVSNRMFMTVCDNVHCMVLHGNNNYRYDRGREEEASRYAFVVVPYIIHQAEKYLAAL